MRFPYPLFVLVTACSDGDPGGAPGASGDPWFVDAIESSGIDFVHTTGPERMWFPEIMTGGVGLLDFDGDGALDVYFVQGGDLQPDPGAAVPGNRLYRNLGGMRFTDVTERSGVGDRGYGMGCACGDYDGDGDTDLYVTNLGADVLYRNDGDGTFTDVTSEAGIANEAWGASAAFVDYDADGDLDLFVVNYLHWSIETDVVSSAGSGRRIYAGPNNFNAPAADVLFRNDGGGRFTDVTREVGLRAAFGNGLGCATGDMDEDGDVDLYVANDDTPNQLWLQQPDGTFRDEALARGCAVNAVGSNEAGMGVHAEDADGDGDLDLHLSHLRGETNTLYANQRGRFDDDTVRSGTGPATQPYTGFGLGFADFDCDGQLDVFVANGRVRYYEPPLSASDEHAEPNLLFRGLGGLRFEEVTPRGGTARELLATSRAAAFGDLDADGGVDVVVVNRSAPPSLLRNVAPRGSWVAFRVVDSNGSRVHDARVRVLAGGRALHRTSQPAYSYCASNAPDVHFGLGAATAIESVVVRWPDGHEQDFGALDANAVHELRRPTR